MANDPKVMKTERALTLLKEAQSIAKFLDGLPITDAVEWNGHTTTPAMLLSLAMNRLQRAAYELDSQRLTYFGFPHT
jgi:hypothetical protein